jgi:hypothetical protein
MMRKLEGGENREKNHVRLREQSPIAVVGAEIGRNFSVLVAATISPSLTQVVFRPAQRRAAPSFVFGVQLGASFHQYFDRFERTRAHGVV